MHWNGEAMAKNGWPGPDDAEIAAALERAHKKLGELYPGASITSTRRNAAELKGHHRQPVFVVGIVTVTLLGAGAVAYRVYWDVQAYAGKLVKIGSM